jgi:histidinol-phosphate aminotransferase
MIDPSQLVRPEIRALSRYHLELSPCRHKLDQNEVPFDLPPGLKRQVAAALVERSWANYPDFHSDELRAALGERHGWPADGVLVGNGSNELLSTALEALASPGQEVLVPSPSFGLYKMFCVRANARPLFLESGLDLSLPLAKIETEVERDPSRPLILCTPNNPTGDAAPFEWVDALLSKLRAPLLLDNAYAEFSQRDYRPLLRRHSHLLIFRTFSKAFSLGGLRLGYLLADPRLVAELIKVKLPYNVGFLGSLAGTMALAAEPAHRRRVSVLLGRRPQWRSLLERHGFAVYPSEANFLLARVPAGVDAARLWRDLEDAGIRVRDFTSYPLLGSCLRFSVGSGRALRAVDAALTRLLARQEAP